MGKRERIKVLISVIGLDGHSIGAEVVCRILMDAGMEVVYLGIYQTPEMIVQAAIQEDVDVIGISSHASNYGQIVELLGLLKKNNLEDICVICGGTIPKHQVEELKETGHIRNFPSPKHFRIHCQLYCFKVLSALLFRFVLSLALLRSRISPRKRSASRTAVHIDRRHTLLGVVREALQSLSVLLCPSSCMSQPPPRAL